MNQNINLKNELSEVSTMEKGSSKTLVKAIRESKGQLFLK